MAGSIKGIIVEIGGDTSGLQKALSQVNKQTSSLSKELRGINSLLKLDPKNTTLLGQKQQILKEQIKATTEQLKNLKIAQQQFIASGGDLNSAQYRNLQREIINTEQKLKTFKAEASNWTAISKQLDSVGTALQKIGEKMQSVGKKLTTTITAPIAGLATAGVKYDVEIEKYTTAFETFLGSAEKASEAVNNIKKDAAKTPFDTKTLVSANQMLISTGESADDARKVILDLGNAISATGGGNAELERMSANLQQIKNAGKATSLDIKQFAYAGIDIYGLLAQSTGKTVQEVKDMDVTFEELSKALSIASSEGGKYAGAMDKISQTTSGQFSILKANFMDLLGQMAESLMPTIKAVAEWLNKLTQKFSSLSDGQKQTITRIALLVAGAGPLLLIFGKIFGILGTVMGGFSKLFGIIGKVTNVVGTLSKILSTSFTVLSTFGKFAMSVILNLIKGLGTLTKVFTFIANPIGIAIAAVTAISTVLVILYNKCEWFRDAVNSVFTAVGQMFTNVFTGIGTFFTQIMPQWITGLIGWFQSIPSNIKNIFLSVLGYITGAFATGWRTAWEGIKNIFSNIVQGLGNIFKTPLNFIIGLLNGFIRGLNKIKIPSWVPGVGGKGINIPEIPKLEKGGIIDSATLAMIGEGKSAEAVVPLDGTLTKYLSQALRETGNASNLTVNFYPQKMTEGEMDRAFNYINRRFGMAY